MWECKIGTLRPRSMVGQYNEGILTVSFYGNSTYDVMLAIVLISKDDPVRCMNYRMKEGMKNERVR
ncbi:hypothetical protein [Methanopyrus sp.]